MHKGRFGVALGTLVAMASPLPGCAAKTTDSGPDEHAASVEQRIEGGVFASPFFFTRSATLFNCTGTKISPNFVLTAAHCQPQVGNKVRFYTDSAFPDPTTDRTIVSVTMRPGVEPWFDDLEDSNGDFADFALVELSAPFNGGHTATMNWDFPTGGNTDGTKVGAGEHNGDPNPNEELLMVGDKTYSDTDDHGTFLTENAQTDGGDSGGGFFVNGKLTGDLWGWVFEWEYRNKYTSIPFHLPFILNHIDFRWSGQPVNQDVGRSGDVAQLIIGRTEKVCQYACMHTSSCVAYSFQPGSFSMCSILTSVTSTFSQSGTNSGLM